MTLAERIRKNEREEKMRIMKEAESKGMKQGIKEGINKTIIKMLQIKLDESIIKEVTGVNDKELEKVKKELLQA